MDWFSGFWPWYVTGPLIGLYVPLLYLVVNRHFGISSTFRDLCTVLVRPKAPYFRYDVGEHHWRLLFVGGIVLGAFLGHRSLFTPARDWISPHTLAALSSLGVRDFSSLVPGDLFSVQSLSTVRGLLLTAGGGFLVGFGTRYAEGCTSGHSIHGLATLQPVSLVATVCFFAGGLAATYGLMPFILRL